MGLSGDPGHDFTSDLEGPPLSKPTTIERVIYDEDGISFRVQRQGINCQDYMFCFDERLAKVKLFGKQRHSAGWFPKAEDSEWCHIQSIEKDNKYILMVGERNAHTSSDGTSSGQATGNNQQEPEPTAHYDTGASYHVTGNRSIFVGPVVPVYDSFKLANGKQLKAEFVGSVCFQGIEIHNVFYCPEMDSSLFCISGQVLARGGYRAEFDDRQFVIMNRWTREVVGKGRLVDNEGYVVDNLNVPRDSISEPPSFLWRAWSAVRGFFGRA